MSLGERARGAKSQHPHKPFFTLSGQNGDISASAICTLAKGLPRLRSLSVRLNDNVDDSVVIFIARACTRLVKVSFDECPITEKAAYALAQHCLALSEVNLQGCRALSDDAIIALAQLPIRIISLGK